MQGGYQNQPKFFVRSHGLSTTAHFESELGWGGSVAQVFPGDEIPIPSSSTNYEIPHNYADCIMSSDNVKIRLIATNKSGSTRSPWYRLNENCVPN